MKKIILGLLVCVSAMCGCGTQNLNDTTKEYISLSCTEQKVMQNNEQLLTSVYKVDNTTEDIYQFPYTSQYPLGTYDENSKSVYYTARDEEGHDQIFKYNVETKNTNQLTTTLRAVNQIIVMQDDIFFVGSIVEANNTCLRLGRINMQTQEITYWGDADTNVEYICINNSNRKIFLTSFKFSSDKENLEQQFSNDNAEYTVPKYTVYETNLDFSDSKELYSNNEWIRLIAYNKSINSLVTVADKEYNVEDPSIGKSISLDDYEVKDYELPDKKLRQGGLGFSADGKKLYGIFTMNDDDRSLYAYDLDTKQYSLVFKDEQNGEKEYINNFQVIYELGC